jgi:hypothetical protein
LAASQCWLFGLFPWGYPTPFSLVYSYLLFVVLQGIIFLFFFLLLLLYYLFFRGLIWHFTALVLGLFLNQYSPMYRTISIIWMWWLVRFFFFFVMGFSSTTGGYTPTPKFLLIFFITDVLCRGIYVSWDGREEQESIGRWTCFIFDYILST